MHELITTIVILRRFPVHLLPCGLTWGFAGTARGMPLLAPCHPALAPAFPRTGTETAKLGYPVCGWASCYIPLLGTWGTARAAPCLPGMGRRPVCLLGDVGPPEPCFQLSRWPDVSSPLLSPPSRVPLVLQCSAQCPCSGLGSDISYHADRSGGYQALPADVPGMICLAEQGMQLHQTVQ